MLSDGLFTDVGDQCLVIGKRTELHHWPDNPHFLFRSLQCTSMCGAGTEYRGISCHEVNNNGYLMKTNYSNNCDPYRAPTTRISCNMGDCESVYLWHVDPWSKVRHLHEQRDIPCWWISFVFSVPLIVIEVNKHAMSTVNIGKHLNRWMIASVFRISLSHESIATDFVSARRFFSSSVCLSVCLSSIRARSKCQEVTYDLSVSVSCDDLFWSCYI